MTSTISSGRPSVAAKCSSWTSSSSSFPERAVSALRRGKEPRSRGIGREVSPASSDTADGTCGTTEVGPRSGAGRADTAVQGHKGTARAGEASGRWTLRLDELERAAVLVDALHRVLQVELALFLRIHRCGFAGACVEAQARVRLDAEQVRSNGKLLSESRARRLVWEGSDHCERPRRTHRTRITA